MNEVTILMACRDGADFLPDQLASIAAQKKVSWRLVAGDDGSLDDTPAILQRFAAEHDGRVALVQGPRAGAVAHFLSLIGQVEGPVPALAFADQDDVWLPGKLGDATSALADCGSVPALYVARVALWDGKGPGRPLAVPRVEPSFGHALVQNIGTGNAMVLNAPAATILRQLVRAGAQPTWHDWWAYQVVTGVGGRVILGRDVALLYRQHARNLVGRSEGPMAVARRLGRAVSGQAKRNLAAQLGALEIGRDLFTPTARAALDRFVSLPAAGPGRGLGAWHLGLRREGALGRVTVALAAGLGAL